MQDLQFKIQPPISAKAYEDTSSVKILKQLRHQLPHLWRDGASSGPRPAQHLEARQFAVAAEQASENKLQGVRQSIIAGLDEEAYGVIPLDEVVDRKSKNKLYDMWQEDLHLLHEAAHALDPLRSV
jgi:hypothetical protein